MALNHYDSRKLFVSTIWPNRLASCMGTLAANKEYQTQYGGLLLSI